MSLWESLVISFSVNRFLRSFLLRQHGVRITQTRGLVVLLKHLRVFVSSPATNGTIYSINFVERGNILNRTVACNAWFEFRFEGTSSLPSRKLAVSGLPPRAHTLNVHWRGSTTLNSVFKGSKYFARSARGYITILVLFQNMSHHPFSSISIPIRTHSCFS